MEVHELSCFRRLYAGVVPLGLDLGVDLGGGGTALDAQVHAALNRDTALWDTGYVCRPSRFLRTPDDPLFPANADLVREECSFLRRTQLDDGSWPVHWAVARKWWRSAIILENLRFLQAFEGW